ncbi:hypothetical protein LXD69_05755 [Flavobacterium sediminilitoris]|uniref:Uncharacterized protein n=1 Tax=Flavobacterium sediminilitoris TaxID=2024526 RepID=A0ABY4HQW2_9FLAO|nr:MULTISPECIES: hypothetical protein [Flavobacterium]UOX35016.1 hypothetical protein LXD69_05755 [Flavobacterium sediminilitoris]
MKIKNNIYVYYCVIVTIILIINLLIIKVFQLEEVLSDANVNIYKMSLFFVASSFLLLATHDYINNKKKEILGFAFLVTLTIKLIICYIFISLIKQSDILNNYEKVSFFILFIEFMLVDVCFTVKILNKKS